MTLTPEQQETITRHLAEKVLGWHKEEFQIASYWMIGDDKVLSTVEHFDPLTDPRDASLVMEAWIVEHSVSQSAYKTSYAALTADRTAQGKTWMEAVCLAIFRASGGTV